MPFFRGLTTKKLFSSASAVRQKKEKDYYLKNGSSVLEELLALCDGNCRIPIRYFTAIEIDNAIKHSTTKMELRGVVLVTGSLDNRPILVRFNRYKFFNIHRDIAITAQMSHLKNVLRLVGCCLEFEEAVMVYEYVEGISLFDLLFKKVNLNRKSLCWGNRLRVARDVASAIVFLHTEFTTPIIHRDIKPSNVIIDDKSGDAKILNFSLSISLPPGELELWDSPLSAINWKDVYDIMIRVRDADSIPTLNYIDRVKNATNLVDRYIKEDNVLDIVDLTILEEHGIEIQQQLKDYLDLARKCTADKGDDRPYMIHVARELCRIEKCFRS